MELPVGLFSKSYLIALYLQRNTVLGTNQIAQSRDLLKYPYAFRDRHFHAGTFWGLKSSANNSILTSKVQVTYKRSV
jgi:hypothetical protein